jgi:hypothetical protein
MKCYMNFFFLFAVLGLKPRTYTSKHSTNPLFMMGFFEIGSHDLFAQDWLQTMILLISSPE